MTSLNVIDIDRIEVATPCTAEWADMVGDDRSRLCLQCEKNVYNFAAMTRREISALIVETEGKFCGRLFRRKDGKVLTADCPLGIRERVEIAASRLSLWVFLAVLGVFAAALAMVPQKRSCGTRLVPVTDVVIDTPDLPPPVGGETKSYIEELRERAAKAKREAEQKLREREPMPGGMRPPPRMVEVKGDIAMPEDLR